VNRTRYIAVATAGLAATVVLTALAKLAVKGRAPKTWVPQITDHLA
jgi:hypothetical protein